MARRTVPGQYPPSMRLALVLSTALWLIFPGSAFAHHSTEGLFDRSRTVEFVGILEKIDMINPHAWFHFDEVMGDGQVKAWQVESDGPGQIRRSMLLQFGVMIELEVGKKYTVRVEPARASEGDGYLKAVVFADGSVFTCCGG